jgi:hypothetical protein
MNRFEALRLRREREIRDVAEPNLVRDVFPYDRN